MDSATNQVAQGEFYIACQYFDLTDSNQFTVGETFRPLYNDDGRRGLVVSVSGKRLYYIVTKSGKAYDTFLEGEVVCNSNLQKNNAIAEIHSRDVLFNRSDILVVDYKGTSVERIEGQVETFNFVVSF